MAEALGVRFVVDVDKRIAGGAEVGVHKTSILRDLERGRPMEINTPLFGRTWTTGMMIRG